MVIFRLYESPYQSHGLYGYFSTIFKVIFGLCESLSQSHDLFLCFSKKSSNFLDITTFLPFLFLTRLCSGKSNSNKGISDR